ncbi:MAG: ABC transporter ATP-binding protein [Gemmatimonadaceae bacterium]|nr:ABC transporter ATP-binding protein [Gemmatimonadaceae bacterium]
MADPKTPKKPKVNTARAWSETRALMWTHRRSLSVGFALMLVNRLSGLVLPASSKYLIDDILSKQQVQLLVPLALAVGAATIVQAITSFALSQVVSIAAQRAITDMRIDVQRHILRLPVSYFDSTKTGVLISRIMTDAEGIRNLVGTGIVQLVGGLLTAVLALGVLFYTSWQLTSITLVVLGGFGVMMAIAFKRLRPIFRERSVINAEVTGRLTETVGGVRIVKVYTAEEREERVFASGVERLFNNVRSTITGTSAVGAATTAIIGVIGVLLTIVGGRAIIAGEMSLGDFVRYIFFIGLVAAPLVSIASIGTQISEAFAGLDRIREIRDMATEDSVDAAKASVPHVDGTIEFRHVDFEYVAGVPVLTDISFMAPAGSTTALVGSSGAGKSTLIGLVMAFHRAKAGQLLVDGRDLDTLKLQDYRRHLGVVMQDNFLFDGSIRDNIAYARPEATDAQVREVARIAHVDEFVDAWEHGYATIVGERGVKLSGGQRQRVAIARAILADPRVLILDEATSSLDSESEAMIRDGLRRLRAGRTTFVIAHRLSTIESADQILVVEQGRIVERGTHPQLMALGGRYKDLHDRQYGIETDRFINPGEDFTPEGGAEATTGSATSPPGPAVG